MIWETECKQGFLFLLRQVPWLTQKVSQPTLTFNFTFTSKQGGETDYPSPSRRRQVSLKLLPLKVVSAHSHCTYSVWNCLRQHFLSPSITSHHILCVRQQTRRKESGDQLSRKAALRPKFIANIDVRGCFSKRDVQTAFSDWIKVLDGIKKNASFRAIVLQTFGFSIQTVKFAL